MTKTETAPRAPRATKVAASASRRSFKSIASEPSTWAGVLSIAAAVITGGASVFADPALMTSVAAGLALVLTKEGS